ncbi:MAG: hypothetical protein FWD25_04405 [Clostridia bacterium]|nr:hypothetical protein [Clostridia bacterium]
MEKLTLRKISFGSYIKLFLLGGVSLGVVIGALLFIMALFGLPVTSNIGTIEFEGIAAGFFALLIVPLALALVFGFFSLFMYPCFRLMLKIFNGIKIKAFIKTPLNSGIDNDIQDSSFV